MRPFWIAFPVLVAASLPAQEYRWEQSDQLGIRFRVHRKLTPVPTRIGSADPHTKVQYEAGDVADRIRGQYSWELHILEFPKGKPAKAVSKPAEGTTTTEEQAKTEEIVSPLHSDSWRQWVTEKDPSIKDRTYQDKAEPKRGKGKTPDYQYWEYSDVDPRFVDEGGLFWYSCAAVYDFPDREIVLHVNIPAIRDPKPKTQWIKWAHRMIGSLEVLDPDDMSADGSDDEPDDRDAYANTPQRQAELEKAKSNIMNLAGWDYFTTPNYICLYSWDPEKPQKQRDALKFANEITDSLETMRELYAELFPPHENMLQLYSILRICDDYNDFSKYSGIGGGVIGWFSPASKELVVFDDKDRYFGNKYDTIYSTTMHEGWHQYGHTYFGEKSELHRWFDEGIGDYFGGWTKKGGRKWEYEMDKGRFDDIRRQIARESFIPPRELVGWERAKFYGPRAPDHYAQAYSMIDFLMRGPERLGKRFDPAWTKILDTYRLGMLETKDQKKAVEKAFEGIDWDVFEETWIEWVKKHMKK